MLSEPITRALLLLCIPLTALSALDGATQTQKLIGPVILGGWGILLALTGRFDRAPWRMYVVWGFLALITIAIVRTATGNPPYPVTERPLLVYILGFGSCALFVWAALFEHVTPEIRHGRLVRVVLAPAVFTGLNLLLYLTGVQITSSTSALLDPQQFGNSTLLGVAHLNVPRVQFPLTPGVTGAGAIAAAGLLMAGVLALRASGRVRTAGWAGMMVCLAVTLLGDSRASLGWAVIALVLVLLLPRAGRRTLSLAPFVLPVAPFVILWVLARLSPIAASFSRAGGTDTQTAGGRVDVWNAVFSYLGRGHLQDIIGWGTYGQQRSGASIGYMQLFTDPFPDLHTTHNSALQAILDIGYIGVIVMLAAFAVTISAAAIRQIQMPNPVNVAILLGLLVLVLSGANEATPSVYTMHTLAAWIMLAAAACCHLATPYRPPQPVKSYNEQVRENRERALVEVA